MKCSKCGEKIVRIERFHANFEITLENYDSINAKWVFYENPDIGTHYHLFCVNECESKYWWNELPNDMQEVLKGNFKYKWIKEELQKFVNPKIKLVDTYR
jgi:hypothetical protein